MIIKDRYVIEKEIGRGGIGIVYLAHDRQLYAKPVVVKVLQDKVEDPDEWQWFQRHFMQEIEALSRIDHPGVVGVLDMGELPDSRPFLVMQFVEGVTLRVLMEESAHLKGLPLPRAAKLLRQIAAALHSAHRKNVIHRDLKPENIMVQTLDDGEELVRLIDFGIAAVKDSRYKDTWRTTTVVGTILYMSPEQLMGNPLLASDVYALGVIAYEMLTGQPPFNPPSHFEMLELQRAGVKARPRELRPELSPGAEELILQALAYDAARRPSHLPDFGAKLAQYLSGEVGFPPGTSPLTKGLTWAPGMLIAQRYQVVRRLGGGLTSTVFLTHDLQAEQSPVAVKEMQGAFMAEDAQTAQRAFQQEAERLARLSHPVIPPLHHHFCETLTNRYYLVSRYVSGKNLAEHQQQAGGKISELVVTGWAIEICEALEYLHTQTPPIMFGDLKPSNVMLDDKLNRLQLLDFGLARLIAPVVRGATSRATLGYAAPELFRGAGEPRSDLYSLGAMMFHLLTGSDPTELPLLIFDFNQQAKPRDLVPEMTKTMDRMICRAVESKPENRYASALAWRQELVAHLAQLKEETTLIDSHPALRCPNCQREITKQAVFCRSCGCRLRAAARLTIQGDNYQSSPPFLLEAADTLIGRADPKQQHFPPIDLTKFDPTSSVSRSHARIKQLKGEFFLEDCKSANGTFLNDSARLPAYQSLPLSDGSTLKMGDVTLKFELISG